MRTFVLTLAAAFALAGPAAAQSAAPSPAASPAEAASPAAVASPAGAASPAPVASPGGEITTAPSALPSAVVVVHVKGFAFVPATVTVGAGQSVRFVQDDQTPHTVSAVDKSFDSGNLDQHQTWSHAFAKPGTYAYICAYHPAMTGTVVVK